MLDYLEKRKAIIADYLTHYIRKECETVFAGQKFGPDVADRLVEFANRGKMIRGGLVFFGAELFGVNDSSPSLVRLAAVMELLQSFLLIHDDIMDRDRLRRGNPSVYAQYDDMGRAEGIDDHLHFGESLGICTGDVAIFIATGLIADSEVPDEYRRPLLAAVSREIARVGLAQMGDVYHGVSRREVCEEDVVDVYRYKTGRYTFSLPLVCGAILAGAPESERDVLGKVGEGLGIVFQIKDDQIGLFGTEAQIGKTVGSDIASDKKTLYRIFLYNVADADTRTRLDAIFGNPAPTPEQIDEVLQLIRRFAVDEMVNERLHQYADHTRSQIRDSFQVMPEKGRRMLEELLEFNLTRSS